MDFRKPKTLFLSPLIAATTILAIFIFALISDSGVVGTWGVNKTIGWAWDFADTASLLSIVSILFFLIIYAILWILNSRLNKTVSMINLILLFILPIVWIFELINYRYLLTFFTALGVIVLLLANTVSAIHYKLTDKQKISS